MTAIGGLWHFDQRPGAADGCTRVLNAQQLYGPHALAQWSESGIALGRRLFHLLPEEAARRQRRRSRKAAQIAH
jgi:hypothetical protein